MNRTFNERKQTEQAYPMRLLLVGQFMLFIPYRECNTTWPHIHVVADKKRITWHVRSRFTCTKVETSSVD